MGSVDAEVDKEEDLSIPIASPFLFRKCRKPQTDTKGTRRRRGSITITKTYPRDAFEQYNGTA